MIRLFFRLPPLAYFVIAALLLGLGYFLQNVDNDLQAEKALALQGTMPEVVDLDAFDVSQRGLANEVHIAAQINGDYNYRLTKDGNNDSSARVMRVLFDPAATGDEKIVRAAIVVRASQSDALWDWLNENIHDIGLISPVSHINGTHKRSVPYDDVAEDAMDDEGLTRAADFFYIDPFIAGREAGLAPRKSSNAMLGLGSVLALIVAAIGGIKILLRRSRRA